jgi:hypothetical protein
MYATFAIQVRKLRTLPVRYKAAARRAAERNIV